MDLKPEPKHIHEVYGTQPGKESFANNCLLARRLAERGVRYIQLFDWGWDSHGCQRSEALNAASPTSASQVDQPITALLTDLKQRGMLEDTLVVWGGEFGRTPDAREPRRHGDDIRRPRPQPRRLHHLDGRRRRETRHHLRRDRPDRLLRRPKTRSTLRDFHATLLRLLGIEHKQMTFPYQGLKQKLTGVKEASVVEGILA